MIVKCEQCQTRFKIPDDKVTDKGVKVRCTKCSHTFRVTRDMAQPAAAPAAEAGSDPFARFGAPATPSNIDVTRPGVFALGVEATRAAEPPRQAPGAFDFGSLVPPASVPPAARPAPAPAAVPALRSGPASMDFSAPAAAPPPLPRAPMGPPPAAAATPAFDFSALGAPAAPAAAAPQPASPGGYDFTQPAVPAFVPPVPPPPGAGFDFSSLVPPPPTVGVAAPEVPPPPAPAYGAYDASAPADGYGGYAAPNPADAYGGYNPQGPTAQYPSFDPSARAAAAAPAPDPAAAYGFAAPEAQAPAPAGGFDFSAVAPPAPAAPAAGGFDFAALAAPPATADGGNFLPPPGVPAYPGGPASTPDATTQQQPAHLSAADPFAAASGMSNADARAMFDMPSPQAAAPAASPLADLPPPEPEPVPAAAPVPPRAPPVVAPQPTGDGPRARRNVVGIVVNVAIAAVLVVGLVVVGSAFLNEGKLSAESLSVENLKNTFAPSTPFVARDVSNGLYETKAGRAVFFVRGEVVNRTDDTVNIVVRAELVEDDTVVRGAESWAGGPPSPEELYLIDGNESLDRLNQKVEQRSTAVPPGAAVPFVVTFTEYPPDLKDFRVRVTARPGQRPAAAAAP